VFFEAPHRIESTLRDLATLLGDRTICVARELTKTHQEFRVGSANDPMFLSITRKGEFSIVVAPPTAAPTASVDLPDADIVSVFMSFDQPMASGGRRGVAALVAKQLGLSVNRVYQAIERTKI
jgi:16S rRNA (cytidine1402-2'-O)-methyltransferase